MLLRTIFLLAFVAVAANSIVLGAGVLAAVALRHRALDAARDGLTNGVHALQSEIAQTLANGGAAQSLPVPAPIATCAYADASGCEFSVRTTFATPTPSASAAPHDCPQTDCTVMLQANSSVDEGRVLFLVTSVVTGPSAATLAARTGIAAFRTYDVAPYASLVGGVDGSVDTLMTGGPADDGGSASSLITVEYAPSGGGSGTAANVWQPLVETSATTAPAWDR